MEKKKIFIEINIPSQVKKRLSQKIEGWRNLPVKWMKEENLHLTVAFVGWVDESMVPEICAKVSDAAASLESFDLEMEKIELGPDSSDPKMIWAVGKSSEQLRLLNEAVEKSLGMFKESHKVFKPHLTLGRIRKLRWEELNEKPTICENIKLMIPVDSVHVMESRGGRDEYIALEECPLA